MKMEDFNKICEIIIIGNGPFSNCTTLPIKYSNVKFTYYEWSGNIVPFAALRGKGIKKAKGKWLLFLDDDHIFRKEADLFLINQVLPFLRDTYNCGLLQLEKMNEEKSGVYKKENAHVWTSRGLLIKNIGFPIKKYNDLLGAGEDLLYGYHTLSEGYKPYCI